MSDNINIRIGENNKILVKKICKNDKTTISDVIREYIEKIITLGTTNVSQNVLQDDNNSDLKHILEIIQKDNNNIINILKTQLEEKNIQLLNKDEQLKSKDRLIENMQILLKEEQNKNTLLLENKNEMNQSKSWFPFFRSKNL